MGRDYSPGDIGEDLTLDKAIDDGFLVRPDYVQLMPKRRDAVREALSPDNRLVQMGDYSKVTLRHVWEKLVADDGGSELARQIRRNIAKYRPARVVVYLPPVAEALNDFVSAMDKTYEGKVFDFRSASTGSPGEAREIFKSFRDRPPGGRFPPILLGVDRFCEGISIKDIDMLVMLRASLSPRVYLHALGRGLRLNPVSPPKERCVVLDAVLFKEQLERWTTPPPDDDDGARSHSDGERSAGGRPTRRAGGVGRSSESGAARINDLREQVRLRESGGGEVAKLRAPRRSAGGRPARKGSVVAYILDAVKKALRAKLPIPYKRNSGRPIVTRRRADLHYPASAHQCLGVWVDTKFGWPEAEDLVRELRRAVSDV